MDFSDENHSTPKLSLTKLPSKHRAPLAALTPPLHPPASVPFLWEEAPGKPIISPPKKCSAVCRSLDLPPRLQQMTATMTSPTAVLDLPDDVSRSSFSSFRSLEEGLSKRESFKENNGSRFISKDNLDFSLSFSVRDGHKIGRRRRSRLFNFPRTTTSGLLTSIYESFKQVVPWRWKMRRVA